MWKEDIALIQDMGKKLQEKEAQHKVLEGALKDKTKTFPALFSRQLSGYTVFTIPATSLGKAGEGVLLAVLSPSATGKQTRPIAPFG